VNVRAAFVRRSIEEALAPVLVRPFRAGWSVVAAEPDDLLEAGAGERIGSYESRNGDLNVDAILRRQARHCGRADVVDPYRPLAESRPDPAREPREVGPPPLGVRLDRDARHRSKDA